MGRSRLVHHGRLTVRPEGTGLPKSIAVAGLAFLACLLLAGCGDSGSDDLLRAEKLDDVYAGSTSSRYGIEDREARGTFTGKILYEGRRFEPRALVSYAALSNDCKTVRDGDVMSEDFIVNDNGTLQNALVWIKQGVTGRWEAPDGPLVLDQVGCRYIPHVAVLQAGQPLVIKSSDDFLHNVRVQGRNETLNKPMPGAGTLPAKKWTKTEVGIEFACDVHSWMQAWVSVVPHPFWSLSGEDGRFRISLPPGKYQVEVWHESCSVKGEESVFDIEVKAGETTERDVTMEFGK